MDKLTTAIPDLVLLKGAVHGDLRGTFFKLFHGPTFQSLGLDVPVQEEYVSLSHRNVLRGMHFQTPPWHHSKQVICLRGAALDVILDLRRASPSFGQAVAVELSPAAGLVVAIPEGCAHGFLALEDDTMMLYRVSSVHHPEHDRGIRWDGFGFDWGIDDPIVSERDRNFPALGGWTSPF